MTTIINGSSPSVTFSDGTTQTTAGLPLTGGTVTGNVTATSFIPTSNTAPTNGMFLAAANTVAFSVSNTEAMRITSAGNLNISNPGVSGRIAAKSATSDSTSFATYYDNFAGTQLGYLRGDGLTASGTAANSPYNFTTGSGANMFVDSNGLVYRSTSSLKYKNNVQDALYGLSDVLKLRPVTYKSTNDGETVHGGLIAEEVDAVGLKEFVQYNADNEPDALSYGNMVSLCIKAIQELNAKVDAQAVEIAALKAK